MAFNWYLKHHHHNYYSLVEPYRENGKNRHHVIKYIGGLTQDEVQRIRRGLAVMKELEIETVKVDDLIFVNHWRYLDALIPGCYLEAVETFEDIPPIRWQRHADIRDYGDIDAISLSGSRKLSFRCRLVQQNRIRPYSPHKWPAYQ